MVIGCSPSELSSTSMRVHEIGELDLCDPRRPRAGDEQAKEHAVQHADVFGVIGGLDVYGFFVISIS
ncbi:hypothetical protein NBRC116596_26410 [Litorivita sp. NS0012-18]